MSFQSLGLSPNIITASGYQSPTWIQREVIPLILASNDVMACAATGTGKTAAFALPIVQILMQKLMPDLGFSHTENASTTAANIIPAYGRNPKVLVLTPTRELAQQVSDSFIIFSQDSTLVTLAAFGGANINPQRKTIAKGIDILVATPGRLFDLLSQESLSLADIDYLVVDEADRMLDLGFVNDIKRIKGLLPKKHQSLFFSATYSQEVKTLAENILHNPAWINAENQTAKPHIEQWVYQVDKRRKAELLAELTGKNNWRQVMVFVNAKETAENLYKELKLDGINAGVFHGDKTQGSRNRALAEFKQGKLQLLVATDIAARGLDIEALPLVINFELPEQTEDYIHRIGRTGRAGLTGCAISLVSPTDKVQVEDIEQLINDTLPIEILQGYELGAPLPERYRQLSVTDPKKVNNKHHKSKFNPNKQKAKFTHNQRSKR